MPNELDSLLSRVGDPALRADLRRQVDVLRERRAFGLVFERHLPERVRLPSHPVRRGCRVTNRTDDSDGTLIVERVEAGRASVVDEEGTESQVSVEELVVVAEFGEPIYPGLKPVGSISRGGNKPSHIVINGENHHALEALQFTHAGEVDCIYIDPPYNTGARDWKYDNDYVDREDAYRHSKWLAFMERRLTLAKKLLNPDDSALIVAIDENEVHRLSLLLQQVFHGRKLQMVTVLANPAGATIVDQFDRVDEHLLFVNIGAAKPARTIANTTPVIKDGKARKLKIWEAMQRSGGNSRREDTKAKFFPVFIDETAGRIVGCGDHLPEGLEVADAPPPPDGCISQWPIKTDGTEACWQLSAPTFRKYLEAGRVRISAKPRKGRWGMSFLTKSRMAEIAEGSLVVTGEDQHGALVVEEPAGGGRPRVGKTLWTSGAYSAREHGSRLLRELIPGRRFPFPKSLYAVEDAVRFYVQDKPNAIVLDFFAGSGTTAHAVFRLNKQDGGRRRSISVTNNEVSAEEAAALRERGFVRGDVEWEARGIFHEITWPRLEAATSGTTPEGEPVKSSYRFTDEFPMAKGFKENVEFFELTYEDGRRVDLDLAFSAVAPLLWMRAGGRGEMVDSRTDDAGAPLPLAVVESYGVLFDSDHWREFVDAVADGVSTAFIVTDSQSTFSAVAVELPSEVEVVQLYSNYLSTFEINRGV